MNDWRPLASENDWQSINRLCDNTLQIYELDDAIQFLEQLQELTALLQRCELTSCDEERQAAMVARLEPLIPHVVDAVDSWDAVSMISIG